MLAALKRVAEDARADEEERERRIRKKRIEFAIGKERILD